MIPAERLARIKRMAAEPPAVERIQRRGDPMLVGHLLQEGDLALLVAEVERLQDAIARFADVHERVDRSELPFDAYVEAKAELLREAGGTWKTSPRGLGVHRG